MLHHSAETHTYNGLSSASLLNNVFLLSFYSKRFITQYKLSIAHHFKTQKPPEYKNKRLLNLLCVVAFR